MFCYHCMRDKENARVCPYCHADSVPEHAPYQLAPGTQLKNYIIGKVLGESGAEISYIGYDTFRRTAVVVEELYPRGCVRRDTNTGALLTDSQENADIMNRRCIGFHERAKKLMSLNESGAIVKALDCFAANHTVYMVSELPGGNVLKDYLKTKGKLDAKLTFSMFKPMMRALDRLHKAGLVVCSISPDAIMVFNYQLTLFDFSSVIIPEDQGASSAGITFKYGYAAPELYENNPLGPYTDVYGLCAVMYTCITGELPVDSVDRADGKNLKSPSQKGCDIPLDLERILMKGLALDPGSRIRSAEQLLAQYNEYLQKEKQEKARMRQEAEAERKTENVENRPPQETAQQASPTPVVRKPAKKTSDSFRKGVNGIAVLMMSASLLLPMVFFLFHSNLWDGGLRCWWQCCVLQLILCGAGLFFLICRYTNEKKDFRIPAGIAVLVISAIAIGLTTDIFTRVLPGKVTGETIESRISYISDDDEIEKPFLESIRFLDKELDIEEYTFPDFYFRDYLTKGTDGKVKECGALLKKKNSSIMNDFSDKVSLTKDGKVYEIALGTTTAYDLMKSGIDLDFDSSKVAAGKTVLCSPKSDSTINFSLKNNTNTEKNIQECTIIGIEDLFLGGDYTLLYRDLYANSDFEDIISVLGKPNDNIGVVCRKGISAGLSQTINFDYQYINGHSVQIYYDYFEKTVESIKIRF